MGYMFTKKQQGVLARIYKKYANGGPTYPTEDGSYIMYDSNIGIEITSTDYQKLYPLEYSKMVAAIENRFWDILSQDMLSNS